MLFWGPGTLQKLKILLISFVQFLVKMSYYIYYKTQHNHWTAHVSVRYMDLFSDTI